MSLYLKMVGLLVGGGVVGYSFLLMCANGQDEIRQKIESQRVYPNTVRAGANPNVTMEQMKRNEAFRNVIFQTAHAKETVYGAKSAAKQGINVENK